MKRVIYILLVLIYYCESVSLSWQPKHFNSLSEELLLKLEEEELERKEGAKPITGKCGATKIGLKHGSYGFIESPNYPNQYPPGIDCEWILKAEPDNSIYLAIFDVRTQTDLFESVTDSLFISLNGAWNDTQRYSGDLNSVTPFTLTTDANELSIRFVSSPLGGNQRGFRLGYYTRCGKKCGNKPGAAAPADDALTVTCGYIPLDVVPAIFPDKGESKKLEVKQEACVEELTPKVDRERLHPFLVALIMDENQFCSGTLINKYHVITSAHCTDRVQKIEMIFGTDDLNIDDEYVQRRIENSTAVITHPTFNAITGVNDISIIRLSEPIVFSAFVLPARLPAWNLIPQGLIGHEVDVHGWGEHDGSIVSQSSSSAVRLAPNVACRASLYKGLTGQMICVPTESMETCKVDSGSPVTTRCKPHVTQNPDEEEYEEEEYEEECYDEEYEEECYDEEYEEEYEEECYDEEYEEECYDEEYEEEYEEECYDEEYEEEYEEECYDEEYEEEYEEECYDEEYEEECYDEEYEEEYEEECYDEEYEEEYEEECYDEEYEEEYEEECYDEEYEEECYDEEYEEEYEEECYDEEYEEECYDEEYEEEYEEECYDEEYEEEYEEECYDEEYEEECYDEEYEEEYEEECYDEEYEEEYEEECYDEEYEEECYDEEYEEEYEEECYDEEYEEEYEEECYDEEYEEECYDEEYEEEYEEECYDEEYEEEYEEECYDEEYEEEYEEECYDEEYEEEYEEECYDEEYEEEYEEECYDEEYEEEYEEECYDEEYEEEYEEECYDEEYEEEYQEECYDEEYEEEYPRISEVENNRKEYEPEYEEDWEQKYIEDYEEAHEYTYREEYKENEKYNEEFEDNDQKYKEEYEQEYKEEYEQNHNKEYEGEYDEKYQEEYEQEYKEEFEQKYNDEYEQTYKEKHEQDLKKDIRKHKLSKTSLMNKPTNLKNRHSIESKIKYTAEGPIKLDNRGETFSRCSKASPNVLLGIMSFGDCNKGYAFTRITAYLDFIARTVGDWHVDN